MSDKKLLAELVWLMRLRQGTFFEPQTPFKAFPSTDPHLFISTEQGQADSSFSVLTRASETDYRVGDDD